MKLKDNIRLYGLFNLFFSLDFYSVLKVIVFYQLTHSYSVAAGLISITLLSSAAGEIPTGVLSDMVGRKKTIILGSVCILAAYILFALGINYWILALGAFLEGIAISMFSGNNNAYLHNLLSDENKEEEYHHHYGRIQSISAFATVIGVFLGGWLASWSVVILLWLNVIPRIMSLIISIFLQDIKREEQINTNVLNHLAEAIKEIKNNLTLRYVSLATILGGGGMAAGELQAAAFAAVWPTWAVGIAKGIQVIAIVPSYYYAGKLIDKFGNFKIMVSGLIISVLGNVLTGLIHTIISPIFVMMSLPLYGASDAAEQKILQKEFTEKQRATIASLNSFGNSVSSAIVLYLCGIIANHYGPFIALLATQIFFIPTIYFYSLFFKRIKDTQ